jgi:hypothetical protein
VPEATVEVLSPVHDLKSADQRFDCVSRLARPPLDAV